MTDRVIQDISFRDDVVGFTFVEHETRSALEIRSVQVFELALDHHGRQVLEEMRSAAQRALDTALRELNAERETQHGPYDAPQDVERRTDSESESR